ncbi:MAG: copper resistance CopC family protein [Acidobacteriota bacterium]|nr:copper resistance CopC family protein [Acidobacteriota bacterium]
MTRKPMIFAVTLVFALASVVAVSAHMAYSKSMPEKDATVGEAPEQVQVWFTQDPEPALSQLRLEGPSGNVALGDTKVADEKSIVAEVMTELAPGTYTVNWRSAGDDGHVQRGDFSFTIRSAN